MVAYMKEIPGMSSTLRSRNAGVFGGKITHQKVLPGIKISPVSKTEINLKIWNGNKKVLGPVECPKCKNPPIVMCLKAL